MRGDLPASGGVDANLGNVPFERRALGPTVPTKLMNARAEADEGTKSEKKDEK
jgi:hypothetical protein